MTLRSNHLAIVVTHRVADWELKLFEPFFESLSRDFLLSSLFVLKGSTPSRKSLSDCKTVWIICKSWIELSELRTLLDPKQSVFVSVLSLEFPKKGKLDWWKEQMASVSESHFFFLAHSVSVYRFLKEIKAFQHVTMVPLPFPQQSVVKTNFRGRLRLGAFGPFIAESNFAFLLLVAHYLRSKNKRFVMRLLGFGPLYDHLWRLVDKMALQDVVEIIETQDYRDLRLLDCLIYGPLKQEVPTILHWAGAYSLPVLAFDTPGISSYIKNRESGFIVPFNHTEAAGCSVEEWINNPELFYEMGQKSHDLLKRNFSSEKIVSHLRQVFFKPESYNYETQEVA